MFRPGQYYRIVKIDLVTFDSLRATSQINHADYEVLNTAVEGEEYPEDERWLKAKKRKEELGSDYYKAKKDFDNQSFRCRNTEQAIDQAIETDE